MSRAVKADVIVTVDRESPPAYHCLQRVLDLSGPTLHRLIVVREAPPGSQPDPALEALARTDPRVEVFHEPERLGDVDACNRGLVRRTADAVLLSGEAIVAPGWLAELAAAAHSEERTAAASPLVDRGASALSTGDWEVRAACSSLPRWTTTSQLDGGCAYLRGDVIDAAGRLDPIFSSRQAAIDDWVNRAQSLGFFVRRANHGVVIDAARTVDPGHATESLHADQEVLERRSPHHARQVASFRGTLDASLEAHASRLQATGKLRVAFDIRHLPPEQVGTRTLAVSLGRALAALPEVELTLLVNHPVQAEGLEGRIVTEEEWQDDVAVIHKPAQVFDRRHLKLLFGSSAHCVITYLDLIAYRVPLAFRDYDAFEVYRTTSGLALQAAQGILALSHNSAREIISEFGIPRDEVAVAHLGVDAEEFARREPGDDTILGELKLPARYFFSVATDYPHKNLSGLLDAYSSLRRRWGRGEPPGLVLVGYVMGAGAVLYDALRSGALREGLIFLGPVPADQLRVLYQHAEAVIYPSLYEGFGLPPLEAMAAGTPVIALPFSSVPEVGGDSVLYTDGLSVAALERAMERMATDEDLREELRRRGLARVARFRWERTARATVEVYRSAVLRPSERSLQMRRLLRNAIVHWSEPRHLVVPQPEEPLPPEPMGIRNALTALNEAVHRRLRREIGRIEPLIGRRSA
jgi:glycosyltransferase involved in cell wall biosynthesis